MVAKQTYQFDKNNHSVYALQYHLVIVVKYRQKAFTDNNIIDRLKQIIKEQAEKFDCQILDQECDIDHIHIIFKAKPQTELVKLIRKEFSKQLKKILWGDSFWNDSYCLITTGQVTLDQLKKYVENQRGKSKS
jgi:putative transposase